MTKTGAGNSLTWTSQKSKKDKEKSKKYQDDLLLTKNILPKRTRILRIRHLCFFSPSLKKPLRGILL
ncbi:hypothetical protein DMA11_18565 [Marinilabiliaceae bacterium JC017]|nr:hypothetical protein DMA11_18565 [Marinilabiliaceae bacterium JC017]